MIKEKFYAYDGYEVPYMNEDELVKAYRRSDVKYIKSNSMEDFNELRKAIEKKNEYNLHTFIPIDTETYCGIFVWDNERKGCHHHHEYIDYYKDKADKVSYWTTKIEEGEI